MKTAAMPLFDYAESVRQRDAGITLAAENNASLVVRAREMAVSIAREQGTVTADDLMRRWVSQGGGIHDFGNSMGAVFRDKRFEFTGRLVKSARVHAKCNLLRQWRLK